MRAADELGVQPEDGHLVLLPRPNGQTDGLMDERCRRSVSLGSADGLSRTDHGSRQALPLPARDAMRRTQGPFEKDSKTCHLEKAMELRQGTKWEPTGRLSFVLQTEVFC